MKIPSKKLSDGTSIPAIGFGTWQLEGSTCSDSVKEALKVGYRHFDTAYAYYNEKQVREGLNHFPREQLFITTKLWRDFHDPKLVEKACDTSLKDLKYDYVDLYLLHWPERKKAFCEIVYQMHRLKEKGKVKSVGLCNATVHHIQDLLNQKLSISMNQIEFHPFLNQEELAKFCFSQNIAITAYCPVAHGKVVGNKTIQQIAQKHQKTEAQVALRWLFQKDFVLIPRSSKKGRIQENFSIFDFKLSEEEMQSINALSTDTRIVNPDFNEFDY